MMKEYQQMSYEERVRYWSGALHQQMRWNVESGVDEYGFYSKKWLEQTKEMEPQIESILEDVFKIYWKNYWDIKKIRKALES